MRRLLILIGGLITVSSIAIGSELNTGKEIMTTEPSKPSSSLSGEDLITLTISADGESKQAAIDNALRNAIEQAYGAFVSSDTRILDDQLVKDEIITLSFGNIHKYKEISYYEQEGRHCVVIDVIVSLSQLCNYAESKGATTELAGATFAKNIKRYNINKENELKIMSNLMELVINSDNLFDVTLMLEEPRMASNNMVELSGSVVVHANSRGQALFDYINNTILSLAMSNEEIEYAKSVNIKYYEIRSHSKDWISLWPYNPYGGSAKRASVGFGYGDTYQEDRSKPRKYFGWPETWPSVFTLLLPDKTNICLRNNYFCSPAYGERVLIGGQKLRWDYVINFLGRKMLDYYIVPRYTDGEKGKNVLGGINATGFKGTDVYCHIELEKIPLETFGKIVSMQATYDYEDGLDWKKVSYLE